MPRADSQPPSIFICYRREDTAGHAGRLYDRLAAHFGEGQVFMDVDLIEPGEDFARVIEGAVGSCDVLLALIGRNWLAGGRLDNPDDFVRQEIAAALVRGVRVIPVLVQGEQMPRPQELPEDLRPLLRLQALHFSDLRWKHDVDQLISSLEKVFARREASRTATWEEEVYRAKPLSLEQGAEGPPEPLSERVAAVAAGTKEERRDSAIPIWKRFVDIFSHESRGFLVGLLMPISVLLLLYVLNVVGPLPVLFVTKPPVSQPTAEKPAGAQANTDTGAAEQDSAKFKDQKFKNAFGMEFIWVPPGEFTMGSEDGSADERPEQHFTLETGFYMGRCEVTQAQWRALMGSDPSRFKGDNLPVESVSWDDAQQFIEKLNQLNDGYSYHLPAEADWEYAARAGTTGEYAGDLDSMAWYGTNSGGRTHPVGQKQANAFGLYDMHGNVKEWVLDAYRASYADKPIATVSQSDRVVRGGSWADRAPFCRSAKRGRVPKDYRYFDVGFRVVAHVSMR